jgi:NAD(P)-dependent dehydrogenase (short-subunit alcohol dehydrogenase family)
MFGLCELLPFGCGWTVLLVLVAVVAWRYFRVPGKYKVSANEAVFVTGCDSGMGEQSALYLAELGYFVFAGCYMEESFHKYAQFDNVVCVRVDVSDQKSIDAAFETTATEMKARDLSLVSLIQAAGIAIMAPIEFFPMDLFRRQIEVNLFGYVAMTQKFFPLIREQATREGGRRGRVMWFGTGGGVPATSPGLISGYMTSKWGIEAFCQSMRGEMLIREYPIDCLMINPGIIKPTGLEGFAKIQLERTWKSMPAQAREEYGSFVDKFTDFNAAQKGEHPRVVAKAVGEAMLLHAPPLRFKVGFESVVSPIVGLLPTDLREWVMRKAMFEHDLPKSD